MNDKSERYIYICMYDFNSLSPYNIVKLQIFLEFDHNVRKIVYVKYSEYLFLAYSIVFEYI